MDWDGTTYLLIVAAFLLLLVAGGWAMDLWFGPDPDLDDR